MSYIDQNLLPDEQILFRTKKHLILFFFPVVFMILAFYIFKYMDSNPMLVQLRIVPALLAMASFTYQGIVYLASDFAVTNRRVMMREGFLIRYSNEMRLSAIAQVNVEQNLLGQLLNFGTVTINGFGGSRDVFFRIASPFVFQKVIQQQIDKIN